MPDKACRVLFLDHTAKMSGGEIALLNLVTHLDQRTYEPVVLLYSEGPLKEKLLQAGVETHVLPIDSTLIEVRKDSLGAGGLMRQLGQVASIIRVARQTAGFIRQHQIDLVHANSLKADIIGGVAARLARRPIVWHVRDRIDDDYLPSVAVRLFRLLARHVPDGIIANSLATLQTLQLPVAEMAALVPSGVSLRRTAHVVHDGTAIADIPAAEGSAAEMSAAKSASAAGTAVVGLIGRISRWKGQHVFLQAAYQVHQQFPQVKFQIIGAALFSEKQYEAELHDLVAKLGLNHVVEFTGFREDVDVAVRQLDILVHASISAEPFGQVVIEGMAAGKPVVATAGGGVLEIVIDGLTGMLVPMGDADAMAAAICRLVANPQIAQRMGQLGEQRVRESFSIQSTARKVERFYDEIRKRPARWRVLFFSLMQVGVSDPRRTVIWTGRFLGMLLLLGVSALSGLWMQIRLASAAPVAGPFLIAVAWLTRKRGAAAGYLATAVSLLFMGTVIWHGRNPLDLSKLVMFLGAALVVVYLFNELVYLQKSCIVHSRLERDSRTKLEQRTMLLNTMMLPYDQDGVCRAAAFIGASQLAARCCVRLLNGTVAVYPEAPSVHNGVMTAGETPPRDDGEHRMSRPIECFAHQLGTLSFERSQRAKAFSPTDQALAQELAWLLGLRLESCSAPIASSGPKDHDAAAQAIPSSTAT